MPETQLKNHGVHLEGAQFKVAQGDLASHGTALSFCLNVRHYCEKKQEARLF